MLVLKDGRVPARQRQYNYAVQSDPSSTIS